MIMRRFAQGPCGAKSFDQDGPGRRRREFRQDPKPARDLGIGFGNPAEIAAEAVLVELLIGLQVPEPARIILKSISLIPTPRKRPLRKSLMRMVRLTMSSRSCGLAQPNAVMCSSDTHGSCSASDL
jgi:hypothetical protein